MNNILFEIIKIAEDVVSFSYSDLFSKLGIKDRLTEMYILVEDLPKKYIDFLMKKIKQFIKQPLFAEINLKNTDDLSYLKTNEEFKDLVEDSIKHLKTLLKIFEPKVKKHISLSKKGDEIPLENLLENVKLDRASMLLILDNLKEENFIYSYDGRSVTY